MTNYQMRVVEGRKWSMPNSSTFSIGPIAEFVERHITDDFWIDPFAGDANYADVTNDLNPDIDTDYTMEATDFLEQYDENSIDGGVIFDPPFSPRQIKEVYNSIGIETKQETTQATFWSDCKNEITRICAPGSRVLTFAWNSGGIGKTNGFVKDEILLIPHGGWHNDTICVAETYEP